MTTNVSRRDFVRIGSLTAAASVASASAASAKPQASVGAKSCIVLFLVGGPSQLETWDPKPDAPAEVRGPFQSIATTVAGVRISEHLPRLASLAHRYAMVRTVHHEAPVVHEAGMQLLQTGHLSRAGIDQPHFGSVLAQRLGPKSPGAAPFVILPSRIGNTGIAVSHGQGAGSLGADFEAQVQARFTQHLAQTDRERYGKTAFGDSCARTIQLVEQGTRCIVVNMFDTVYDRITWDCHAGRHSLPGTLDDYRRSLCPTFDRAFSALLGDLHERGLLDETLVIAMGEFGRTPRLNANGGRDHWPGCWSIVMAGGGVRGGQVIGASDRIAAEPIRRPVHCSELVATVYNAFGLPLTGATPIRELF